MRRRPFCGTWRSSRPARIVCRRETSGENAVPNADHGEVQMNRSGVALFLSAILLTACSAPATDSASVGTAAATHSESQLNPTTTPVAARPSPSVSASAAPASPVSEEPPKEAVAAALSACISPECEYPSLRPGSRRLSPEAGSQGDRWCIQASFTVEGQQQPVAVIVSGSTNGSALEWRPGEAMGGVDCQTVK